METRLFTLVVFRRERARVRMLGARPHLPASPGNAGIPIALAALVTPAIPIALLVRAGRALVALVMPAVLLPLPLAGEGWGEGSPRPGETSWSTPRTLQNR